MGVYYEYVCKKQSHKIKRKKINKNKQSQKVKQKNKRK